jgi:2-hydroxy-6-oxonona-2,4-dienedioate hydrolase
MNSHTKKQESKLLNEHTEASTSRFVQTKKWKFHINEAGSGPPLILLHGGGPGANGWSNYQHNIGPLSRKYRVIVPDVPGYGKSDEFTDTDSVTDRQTESIALLMDALEIEKAALCGNSMGGLLTLNFAANYNNRITHMVTMGTGLPSSIPLSMSPAGPGAGLKTLLQTFRSPTPANFRLLCETMLFDSSFMTDELLEQRSQAALANQHHLDNFLHLIDSGKLLPNAKEGAAVVAKLAEINTPALVMHGRDDRVVGLEASLRIVSVLKNSQLMIFNRCGHWVQLERAEMFNRMLDSFLSVEDGASDSDSGAFGG